MPKWENLKQKGFRQRMWKECVITEEEWATFSRFYEDKLKESELVKNLASGDMEWDMSGAHREHIFKGTGIYDTGEGGLCGLYQKTVAEFKSKHGHLTKQQGPESGKRLEERLFVVTDQKYPALNLEGVAMDTDANLEYWWLERANFRHALIARADLSRCKLTGSDFTGAYIRNVKFDGSMCQQVNFTGANFGNEPASCTGTFFVRSNFTAVTGISGGDWAGANLKDIIVAPLLAIQPRRVQQHCRPCSLLQRFVFQGGEDEEEEDEEGEEEDEPESQNEEDPSQPLLEQVSKVANAASDEAKGEVEHLQGEIRATFDQYMEQRASQGAGKVDKKLSQMAQELSKKMEQQLSRLQASSNSPQISGILAAARALQQQSNSRKNAGAVLESLHVFQAGFDHFKPNEAKSGVHVLNAIEASLRSGEAEGMKRATAAFITNQVESKTKYATARLWSRCYQACTLMPTTMHRDLKELDMLRQKLEELQQPVTRQSWDHAVDGFLNFYHMAKDLKGERSHALLVQIFADKELCKLVAVGKLFKNIGDDSSPPDQVVGAVKKAASIIRGQYYTFNKAIQREQTHIERILSMQQRSIGLCGTLLVGLFVACGNFAQEIVTDYMRQAPSNSTFLGMRLNEA